MDIQETEITTVEMDEGIYMISDINTYDLTNIESTLVEINNNVDEVITVNQSILVSVLLLVAIMGILVGVNLGNVFKGK